MNGEQPAKQTNGPGRKQREDQARLERARRAKRVRRIAIAAVIVAVLGSGVWAVGRYARYRNEHLPGEAFASAGREHVGLGDPLPRPYTSNPPSSGAHYPQPANWGVYDYEVNDRIFIHNLEHGGIWISYRPSISPAAVAALREVVKDLGGAKLVMAPRSANDTDVAVAAWQRVFAFNLVNGTLSDQQRNQVKEFYRALRDRGPEFVPDSMPGIDPKSVQ